MNGFAEWSFAISCLRLSHVAAGRDFWRDCLELYAAEAGPLWRML
jgi:hypothetical protein